MKTVEELKDLQDSIGKEVLMSDDCRDCGHHCSDNTERDYCSKSGYLQSDLEDGLAEADENGYLTGILIEVSSDKKWEFWLRKEGVYQVKYGTEEDAKTYQRPGWFVGTVDQWKNIELN